MSTYIYHNLENEINEFFSNTNVTRQQCDELAISRAGGVATPVENQGTCSYTITAGSNNAKLFQFRVQDSFIDMGNLSLAKAVHPEFVARCEYLGTIGDSHPLHIYEMDNLPGTIYMLAGIPPDDISRRYNIIKDLARFFTQSWNNNQQLSVDDTTALLSEFQSNFDLLVRDLPSRFTSNLNRVRKELPSIFSGAFPFILSHGDFNEGNLLISSETGNITGVIDWAEAKVLPFGFSLYGLENIFGFMSSDGWHYHDNHRELESLFWQAFREEVKIVSDADLHLIRAARIAGLFYRYGLIVDWKGVVKGVRDQSHSSFKYLDAFCTADDWAPIL